MKRTPEEQAEVYKSLYKTNELINEILGLEWKEETVARRKKEAQNQH